MKRMRDSTAKSPTEDHHSLIPSQCKILRPEEVQWARRRLWTVLGIPLPKTMNVTAPTAQPVALQRDKIESLLRNKNSYRVSLKADGVRYLFLLTQRKIKSTVENVALMFDRALTPYEMSVWAPEIYFEKNSLFDGELVVSLKNQDLTYLVFDVMVWKGERVGDNCDYDKRLSIIQDCFEVESGIPKQCIESLVSMNGKILTVNHDTKLVMMPKPCVSIDEISSLWRSRKESIFNQDGLIFMPVQGAVRFGKHEELLKWKDQHTIDVQAELKCKKDTAPGKRIWDIYIMDGKKLINVSESDILTVKFPDKEKTKIKCRIIDNLAISGIMEDTNNIIVECSVDIDTTGEFLNLYPIRHRYDKNKPNSIVTVESTIQNAVDHIHIEDLLSTIAT